MWGISSKSERRQRDKTPKKPKLKRITGTNIILWRYFTFFALGVIAVIALVCYGISGNALLTQTKRRVRTAGEDLIEAINDVNMPLSALERKVSDYGLLDGIDVFIFSLDGELIMPYIDVPPDKLKDLNDVMNANIGEWESDKKTEIGRAHV